MNFFPPYFKNTGKTMVFVDGENITLRYASHIEKHGIKVYDHVFFQKDIYVWSTHLTKLCCQEGVLRKYFFTSVAGNNNPSFEEVEDALKDKLRFEAVYAFRKCVGKAAKRVDVTLTTTMLLQAMRKNIDTAILVTGDDDFVPLVEAVKNEGCRVILWSLKNGLSRTLRLAADFYADIGEILFEERVRIL